MKKQLFKAITAFALALCLVFCFAGCSDGEQKNTQTNNQPANAVQTDADITEFVNAYNKALESSNIKCTSSNKKIEMGKLWLGDKSDETMDLLAEEQKELLAKFESSESGGVSLSALKESDVAEVSVNENIVTFTLKSSSAENAVAQGQGGYINIIDTEATQELVEGVKSFANVNGNVKVNSSSYSMSDGTLIVTYNNKKHKKIESVSFSGKQNVKAEMKYFVISINAELDYALSSEYKAQ